MPNEPSEQGLRALIARIEDELDDAEGWVRIVSADWSNDELRLRLSARWFDDTELEHWLLRCQGVVEESLSAEGSSKLQLSASSPLLLPYTEPSVDLCFSDNRCRPALLQGIVYASCMECFGRAEYVERFLNGAALHPDGRGNAFGMLGRFPQSLADRIATALADEPIRLTAMPGIPPRHWTGSEFVEHPPLQVVSLGRSYVIGTAFSAAPERS